MGWCLVEVPESLFVAVAVVIAVAVVTGAMEAAVGGANGVVDAEVKVDTLTSITFTSDIGEDIPVEEFTSSPGKQVSTIASRQFTNNSALSWFCPD